MRRTGGRWIDSSCGPCVGPRARGYAACTGASAPASRGQSQRLPPSRRSILHEPELDPIGQVDSEFVLTPGARAAKSARTLVGDCAGPFVDSRLLGDAQLLVTELVGNSFVHGDLSEQDRIRVRVLLTAAALRLEVRNPGIAGAIAPDRGHGLEMVSRLSSAWGVERDRDTCVWAELPVV